MDDSHDAGDPLAIPQIQTAHIDAFTPYVRNARTHPPEQAASIMRVRAKARACVS